MVQLAQKKKELKVLHKWWAKNDEKQKWLQYILDKWWEDMVRTFLAENWTMWITRRSEKIWYNWYYDFGICQINSWYHPEILWQKRKFADWFYDPYKQIDKCIELYNQWTKLWWYDHRFERTKDILIIN